MSHGYGRELTISQNRTERENRLKAKSDKSLYPESNKLPE